MLVINQCCFQNFSCFIKFNFHYYCNYIRKPNGGHSSSTIER